MFESLADMLESAFTLKKCPFCGEAAMVHQSKKYNAKNGWGTVSSAKECLDSVVQKIGEIVSGDWSWNEIPLEHLWIRW